MINVTATPQPLSFVGNKPTFVLACSAEQSQGSLAAVVLQFAQVASMIGMSAFTLTLEGIAMTFYLDENATAGDAYRFATVSELVDKLNANYYLSGRFRASLSSQSAGYRVTLTALQRGRRDISVTDINPIVVTNHTVVPGTDAVLLDNYAVVARFEVDGVGLLPWCRYIPVDGSVKVSGEMLADIFGSLPLPDGTRLQQLSLPLKYRLQYAEEYGSPALVQRISSTGWNYLLPGELIHSFASANLPDWLDARPAVAISTPNVRVLGEDTGITVDFRRDVTDYLYLTYPDVTGSAASQTVTPTLTQYAADGTATTATLTALSLSAGKLFRFAVGATALGIATSTVAFRLVLSVGGTDIFTRDYSVRPSFKHSRQFLLENKYGLLVASSAMRVVRSLAFEGDEVVADGVLGVDVHDVRERFTAYSPAMSFQQARRLGDCLAGRHQWLLASGQWQPVVIYPGTFQLHDDDANLARVSFEFSFRRNQVRNTTLATLSGSAGGDVDIPDVPILPDLPS